MRRRDAAGGEADMLAKVMNDPEPDAGEVTGYIRKLLKMEHIPPEEARMLLAGVPHDPEALREWAQRVFQMVMHQGIHAHAAFPRSVFPSPQSQQEPEPQEATEPTVPAPQGPQP